MKRFSSLDELYLNTLSDTYFNYSHLNSPRGFLERENIGFKASIAHPEQRYCLNKARMQNIAFCYAEALWYLSGDNDLEFISHYAPSMCKYSADGKTLPGTGYGKRLLAFGENNLDQIERAIDVLQTDDPDSKRVFLQVFNASENIYKDNIDVSCTIGLQLLLRSGKLHMVGMMRANDAYVGLLSDVFSFTFIQEYIAVRLGCELGEYHHMVGSIHTYDQNDEKINKVLSNKNSHTPPAKWPTMSRDTTRETIDRVLSIEKEIRLNKRTFSYEALIELGLSQYWIEIVVLFETYQQIKRKHSVDMEKLDLLHPTRRQLVENKWQTQFAVEKEARTNLERVY